MEYMGHGGWLLLGSCLWPGYARCRGSRYRRHGGRGVPSKERNLPLEKGLIEFCSLREWLALIFIF
jgi:hypothetical protein